MPDVRGMALMDAVSVLENKGLNVAVQGNLDFIKKQSLARSTAFKRGQQVVLY